MNNPELPILSDGFKDFMWNTSSWSVMMPTANDVWRELPRKTKVKKLTEKQLFDNVKKELKEVINKIN